MKRSTPKCFLPCKSYRKLLRSAATFADSLRKEPEFAGAINADRRKFRSDVQRAIRAQFPLRRGRPTDPLLDRACGLLRQGKSVAEVLRSQIPGFETFDTYSRYLMEKGLRQAAKRRSKRPKNPHRNFRPKNKHSDDAPK